MNLVDFSGTTCLYQSEGRSKYWLDSTCIEKRKQTNKQKTQAYKTERGVCYSKPASKRAESADWNGSL